MELTKNFSLYEMTVTNSGIPNEPNEQEIANLKLLCENVLQPLRNLFGRPIKVTSGFRCEKVNKHIGGVASSEHVQGMAADLVCENNAELFNLIRHRLPFTQLIWERGNSMQPSWVHVSFDIADIKKQVLKFDGKRYTNL
jgi:zinc D-Ala-D-Ala carboxypeptidase